MKLHCLQHVPFETPAAVGAWAHARGHRLGTTRLYAGGQPPEPGAFDWLLILGGPMGVHDIETHPWLGLEKAFLREVLATGKKVLGVCLGAQLLAESLGAHVSRNREKEIGWFPVRLREEAADLALFRGWPEEFHAFHWHGDTFSIPPRALPLAASAVCANQGFLFNSRVLGLQFHLEYNPASIEAMLEHCGDEIEEGGHVQEPEQIRAQHDRAEDAQELLFRLLDAFAAL